MKFELKEKAIGLRKQGFTYNEILKDVPVVKSTLSLWLRSVGLAKRQKQIITEKRIAARLKGAFARKQQRIFTSQSIYRNAEAEIDQISERELWLLGIALYWAEGSKEKEAHPGTGVAFSNSDGNMVGIFLRWLVEICKVPKENIIFEIYIHENSANSLLTVKEYWTKITGFPRQKFDTVYFKRNKIKTNRKNTKTLYYGLLRVKVRASSALLRKITGWVRGINKTLGSGVTGNTPAFGAGDSRFET